MIQLEYLVEEGDLFAKEIPIGYAYQNVYVLDKHLNQVKVNEIGELYVGGNALSIGYLNNPKLTLEKFITNPFYTNKQQNNKLYKSGDLVKLLPNDKLEYIGRDDFQIKLRGNRIELGEIESCINKYNSIQQSVVIAKSLLSNTGEVINTYLVGYYVSKLKLDETDVLNYLKQMLPDYMVPNILIHLDGLPLNINGKLDRNALPLPESLSSNNYHPAQNLLESEVIDIFADLLGVSHKNISFTDDFFRLGGNSLLVIRLVAKLNHKFKSNLKTQDIYQLKAINKIYNLMQESLGQFCYDEYQVNGVDEDNLYKPFPLTNVQQAYYLGRFGNFNLGNVATHDYIEYKFNFLDVNLLQKTFNQLLKRHLALRSIFVDNQQQYLATVPEYEIMIYDESERLSIRNMLSHKVYTPSNYPLFDICVSISSTSQYFLHISYDALLMDANSFKILFMEWTNLYNNPTIVLNKLNITYRDYILKFNQVRSSNLWLQAENYWLNKLDTYNFNMSLPLINKDSEIKKPTFKRITKTIANDVWNKIVTKAHHYGISPTIVIIAAYGQVLSHWANQKNICINLTLFNRLPLHEDVNDVIGDFTVLELFNYHSNMTTTINQLFNEIHSNLWHDIENNLFDGIDFQRLIRKHYQLSDTEVVAPVVLTCLFGMKTAQDEEAFLDPSYQGVNYSITQTSQVWLDHKAYENKDGLVAEWDYVEELFAPDVIEQMHADYCNLIELLALANWEIDKLPQINLSLVDRNLIEACNTATQERSNDTLFSRCESIVATHELNLSIAVIDDIPKCEYSYKHLLSEGLFLTKYILWYKQSLTQNKVVSKNLNFNSQLIGVFCEKSYLQVLATYSVMKSGHGYLPLNIDWPIGRAEEILDEGNVLIVLISRSEYNKKDGLAKLSSKYHLLVIEDVLLEISSNLEILSQLNHIKLPSVMASDIAYVIFTSGSTGKPKGVTISHQGAVNTIDAVNRRFNVTSSDTVLAVSDLSFDLSVYDIFGLLFVGGTIVFPQQLKIKDQTYWLELVNKYKVTLWNSVPQLTELLINEAKRTDVSISSLRLFLMSGDFISVTLPSRIKELAHNAQVVSLGGATEGSIWSIWYEIIEVPSVWSKIPYGVAMPNQKMYILNYNLKHCPVGILGDIYIGGDGVAINYWQDKEKTMASFIEHESLGRLYKTGDIGCWNKNGYMEFMGRSDNQVKINGYRIELEEINNNLLKISGIKDSVVVYQKFGEYLVGYLVLDNNKKMISTDQKKSNLEVSIEEFKLKQYGILN
jgi:amino acid adenylation domain-containing protein